MTNPVDLITGILDYFFFPNLISSEIWIATIISIAVIFVLLSVMLIPKIKSSLMRFAMYMFSFTSGMIILMAVLAYPFDFISKHLNDCMDTRIIVRYNLDEIVKPALECRYRDTAIDEWGDWKLVKIY
jgi:hypothetical protein